MNKWTERTGIPAYTIIQWIGMARAKYHDWKKRYGKVIEYNSKVPRDHWLTEEEKQRIIDFYHEYPGEGYRRLTYIMIDRDIVACSPATVHRVLQAAGVLKRRSARQTTKGTGFQQPLKPHDHWHVDVSHINISGTFYYLCSVLDGYSRAILHQEIREQMKEGDVEIIIQRARELYPDTAARIITDNGPQFVARDFKIFVRECGMTHVKTSPYYPQSNGKIERFHRTLKDECIRPGTPLSLADAQRIVANYVEYYNTVRLHSSIDYITPMDKLNGHAERINQEREKKLASARENRRRCRMQAAAAAN